MKTFAVRAFAAWQDGKAQRGRQCGVSGLNRSSPKFCIVLRDKQPAGLEFDPEWMDN